ncbi:MAG: hypothetical protein AB1391_03120 [Candidatus Micrarchaeota archaeon]
MVSVQKEKELQKRIIDAQNVIVAELRRVYPEFNDNITTSEILKKATIPQIISIINLAKLKEKPLDKGSTDYTNVLAVQILYNKLLESGQFKGVKVALKKLEEDANYGDATKEAVKLMQRNLLNMREQAKGIFGKITLGNLHENYLLQKIEIDATVVAHLPIEKTLLEQFIILNNKQFEDKNRVINKEQIEKIFESAGILDLYKKCLDKNKEIEILSKNVEKNMQKISMLEIERNKIVNQLESAMLLQIVLKRADLDDKEISKFIKKNLLPEREIAYFDGKGIQRINVPLAQLIGIAYMGPGALKGIQDIDIKQIENMRNDYINCLVKLVKNAKTSDDVTNKLKNSSELEALTIAMGIASSSIIYKKGYTTGNLEKLQTEISKQLDGINNRVIGIAEKSGNKEFLDKITTHLDKSEEIANLRRYFSGLIMSAFFSNRLVDQTVSSKEIELFMNEAINQYMQNVILNYTVNKKGKTGVEIANTAVQTLNMLSAHLNYMRKENLVDYNKFYSEMWAALLSDDTTNVKKADNTTKVKEAVYAFLDAYATATKPLNTYLNQNKILTPEKYVLAFFTSPDIISTVNPAKIKNALAEVIKYFGFDNNDIQNIIGGLNKTQFGNLIKKMNKSKTSDFYKSMQEKKYNDEEICFIAMNFIGTAIHIYLKSEEKLANSGMKNVKSTITNLKSRDAILNELGFGGIIGSGKKTFEGSTVVKNAVIQKAFDELMATATQKYCEPLKTKTIKSDEKLDVDYISSDILIGQPAIDLITRYMNKKINEFKNEKPSVNLSFGEYLARTHYGRTELYKKTGEKAGGIYKSAEKRFKTWDDVCGFVDQYGSLFASFKEMAENVAGADELKRQIFLACVTLMSTEYSMDVEKLTNCIQKGMEETFTENTLEKMVSDATDKKKGKTFTIWHVDESGNRKEIGIVAVDNKDKMKIEVKQKEKLIWYIGDHYCVTHNENREMILDGHISSVSYYGRQIANCVSKGKYRLMMQNGSEFVEFTILNLTRKYWGLPDFTMTIPSFAKKEQLIIAPIPAPSFTNIAPIFTSREVWGTTATVTPDMNTFAGKITFVDDILTLLEYYKLATKEDAIYQDKLKNGVNLLLQGPISTYIVDSNLIGKPTTIYVSNTGEIALTKFEDYNLIIEIDKNNKFVVKEFKEGEGSLELVRGTIEYKQGQLIVKLDNIYAPVYATFDNIFTKNLGYGVQFSMGTKLEIPYEYDPKTGFPKKYNKYGEWNTLPFFTLSRPFDAGQWTINPYTTGMWDIYRHRFMPTYGLSTTRSYAGKTTGLSLSAGVGYENAEKIYNVGVGISRSKILNWVIPWWMPNQIGVSVNPFKTHGPLSIESGYDRDGNGTLDYGVRMIHAGALWIPDIVINSKGVIQRLFGFGKSAITRVYRKTRGIEAL